MLSLACALSSCMVTKLTLSVCYVPDCCCSVAQSCLALCDPMDCSLSGSSFHGILQARVLEWVPIFFLLQGIFSTQGSNLQLLHWQVDSLPSEPPGKPQCVRLFAYKKNENSFFFYNSTNPVELSNNLVELIIFIPFYGGRNWQ